MNDDVPNQVVTRPRPRRGRRPDGDGRVRIAAFSCDGLEALARSLGFPVAVVAAVPEPEAHLERLRDTWYASGTPRRHDDWPLPFDFDHLSHRDWWKVRIDPRWFGRRRHALSAAVEDGHIVVELPPGTGRARYAAAFEAGLGDLRFEVIARRPGQCLRRHHSRRALAVTSRYALASAADRTPVEVRDLVLFCPRTLPRIADAALAALARSAAPSAGRDAPASHGP